MRGNALEVDLEMANDPDTNARRDDGKRFDVRADDKLTAFLGLESAISAQRRIDLTDRLNFLQT